MKNINRADRRMKQLMNWAVQRVEEEIDAELVEIFKIPEHGYQAEFKCAGETGTFPGIFVRKDEVLGDEDIDIVFSDGQMVFGDVFVTTDDCYELGFDPHF